MAVGRWAHVTDGVCDNVILLDPDTAVYPMDGLVLVSEGEDAPVGGPGIGWAYDAVAEVWHPPVE